MITYLQINLLLGLSFGFFLIFQKISAFIRSQSSPVSNLRCAQFLVVFSLVTPLMLKFIPSERLPALEDIAYRAFPEGRSNELVTKSSETTRVFVEKAFVQAEEYNEAINFDLMTILYLCWMTGVLFFLTRFFINFFRLQKILGNSVLLRKSSRIRIGVSQTVSVPFSVRLFRYSWVVIPMELMTNKKDFTLALKHELQHHRQGDTLWAMGIELLTCFLFLNPAIYLWKNTIIELQEFSCDDALSGQKDVSSYEYGSCLLRVAETALLNRQMYAGTTSMAAVFRNSKYFKTILLRRIEMIMDERKSRKKWIPVCTGLTIGLLSIAVAFATEKIVRKERSSVNPGELVVDPQIQKITDDALFRAMKRTKATSGFIIVSEPQSGRILAVANYDSTRNRKGHWALSQLIEPASIAKSLVVARAIEENKITVDEKISCENGAYKYKGKTYKDWKEEGWDSLTPTEAMAISSNICIIKIGEKLGEEGVIRMLHDFGFGQNGTAEDLPEARVGEFPEQGPQIIPQISVGFGYRSSPIEINQAYGAIANGGKLMRPVMANAKDPNMIRRVLSEESAGKMRKILEQVVLSGTAKDKASSDLYTTAGKTATGMMNELKPHDWSGIEKANMAGFIGFAPVNNPQIQVFVGMINPNSDNTGAHGSTHAAPAFKEVIENVLTHLKVAPDNI